MGDWVCQTGESACPRGKFRIGWKTQIREKDQIEKNSLKEGENSETCGKKRKEQISGTILEKEKTLEGDKGRVWFGVNARQMAGKRDRGALRSFI